MAELKGNKYGIHRVIEPQGVLTQAAWKIDNDMTKVYSNEIVCDVTSLNIDSASFTQIEEACGGDEKKIGEMIMGIVAERGKQQNPEPVPAVCSRVLLLTSVRTCSRSPALTSRSETRSFLWYPSP